MTRRREVGIIKSFVLGAALAAALAVPAQAGDNKLALSGSAVFTTDYMFRSISQHGRASRSAGGIRSDLRHVLCRHLGIQYRTFWGSHRVRLLCRHHAEMELELLDRHLQLRRPLLHLSRALTNIDYFEAARPAATWTGGAWTLGINNYWSPDNFQFFDEFGCDRRIGRVRLLREAFQFLLAQRQRRPRLPVVRSECYTITPIGTPA